MSHAMTKRRCCSKTSRGASRIPLAEAPMFRLADAALYLLDRLSGMLVVGEMDGDDHCPAALSSR